MDESISFEQCQNHSGLLSDVAYLKKETEDQWTAINNLRNRLPTWATLVISLLTFLLGCSVTFAALADRISHGGTE